MNERLGIIEERLAWRNSVLSTARISEAARARIKGDLRFYQPITPKTHTITVNCAKPEERTVESDAPPPVQPVQDAPAPAAAPVVMTHKHWRPSRPCNRILEAVTVTFKITLGELMGEKRHRRLAVARFAAAHLLKKHCGLSTTQIGKTLKRDHTTVMHELIRAEGLLATDPDWTALYRAAEHALDQKP